MRCSNCGSPHAEPVVNWEHHLVGVWCSQCRTEVTLPRGPGDPHPPEIRATLASRILPAVITTEHPYIRAMLSDAMGKPSPDTFRSALVSLALAFADQLLAQVQPGKNPPAQYAKDSIGGSGERPGAA